MREAGSGRKRRRGAPGRARIALVGASLLLVGACGFEPLYGERPGGATASRLEQVQVAPIADRSGQILRNYLLDDLNPRGPRRPALYTLEIRLQEPRQQIAIRRDDTATRIGYAAVASFFLLDTSGRSVFGGSAISSTSYEVSDSEFATRASQVSARDRAMQEISADIRSQLALFFLRAAAPPERAP
ncbi:MAG: hypothetical protein ACT4P2_07720 [Pseudomonadota bacterium]